MLSQRQQIEVICVQIIILKSRCVIGHRGKGCKVLGIKIQVAPALAVVRMLCGCVCVFC